MKPIFALSSASKCQKYATFNFMRWPSWIFQNDYLCQFQSKSNAKFTLFDVNNRRNGFFCRSLWLSVHSVHWKWKNCVFGRGHFVLPNMATPLNFGSGARQILIQQVLNYKCANFHAFAPICTILPLRDWTRRKREENKKEEAK